MIHDIYLTNILSEIYFAYSFSAYAHQRCIYVVKNTIKMVILLQIRTVFYFDTL